VYLYVSVLWFLMLYPSTAITSAMPRGLASRSGLSREPTTLHMNGNTENSGLERCELRMYKCLIVS
jgi:hypothetical protein